MKKFKASFSLTTHYEKVILAEDSLSAMLEAENIPITAWINRGETVYDDDSLQIEEIKEPSNDC